MLKDFSPQRAAIIICVVALLTIGAAWIFEFYGYSPCPLCLQQRWAYYAALPVAVIAAMLAPSSAQASRGLLYLLALIWAASAVFAVYHSGVEWKWWAGPETFGGELGGGLPDLSKPVVRCDEAALRILGVSLAGWNVVISLALAVVAVAGARRHGSSSVSQ